ncbi:MAG: hypothetical protein SOT71_08010 [Romboutsia timonensis]|uniref:hypothetical protein n=1 Tax=Romboutsia timonensis TaxID=1776391 RepID=UPI002A75E928|nr:hypothetical protein [Romboutsia timonensis]MDY2882582.1 hypothetical protein [Romboutsia timonensis]
MKKIKEKCNFFGIINFLLIIKKAMQKITENEKENFVYLIGDEIFDDNKIVDFYGEQLDSLKNYSNYNNFLKIVANAFFCSFILKNNLVKNKENKNRNEIIGSLFEDAVYKKIEEIILYAELVNFNVVFKIIKENLQKDYLKLM